MIGLTLAMLLAAQGAPAAADDAEDAECLVALALLGGQQDETVKASAIMFSLYYLGRLDGRGTSGPLTDRVRAAATAIEDKPMQPILARCVKPIEARASDLKQAAEDLRRPGAMRD